MSLKSELCLLNKEVSGFLPVLCGWVNLYLSGFCAAFGFLGDTLGAASWEVPIFTVLLGFGLDEFAAWSEGL